MVKDRLVAGALAGIIGGTVQYIYGTIIKAIGISGIAFKDFGEIIILSKDLKGLLSSIVGLIAHLTLAALFGVVFAFLIQQTSRNYFWVKTVGFSLAVWFFPLAVGTIFKLPRFSTMKPHESLLILLGALIYSFVTAYVLSLIESRSDLI